MMGWIRARSFRPAISSCLVVFSVFLAGCASIRDAPTAPSWWADTHKHDMQFLYFKAKGESSVSSEEARSRALDAIKGQIAEYIFSSVAVSDSGDEKRVAVDSEVELREVETYEETEVCERGSWAVYMLGRYPRLEYEKIKSRLELADRLSTEWSEAQSAFNRHEFAVAEKQLVEVISSYDEALRPAFHVEESKLLLASLYLQQNCGLKARRWLDDVVKSSSGAEWRKQAEDMVLRLPPVTLRDAFAGHTVGICCYQRTTGRTRACDELNQELSARLTRDGVQTAILNQPLDMGQGAVSDAELRKAAGHAAESRADVLFFVLLDIDPSKTGQRVEVPGVSGVLVDALDTHLYYYIVRASDGMVLASDSTEGTSQAKKHLAATILTHRRHLPNYSTTIFEKLH